MNEMFAVDVGKWFADLAVGAKAQTRALVWGERSWQRATTYDNPVRDAISTVYIHHLKDLAEQAGFDVQHRDFVLGDYYYLCFRGEDFVIFNGVKFADFTDVLPESEKELRRAEKAEAEKREEEDEDD